MLVAALIFRLLLQVFFFVEVSSSRFLSDSTLGLTEIAWHQEMSHIYLGSPSILRLPNGDILASADRFGSGFKTERNVSLYRSIDNGTSWTPSPIWIEDQYWSNLFQVNPKSNDVYILGTSTDGPAPIKISKSSDNGQTWSETATLFGSIRSNSSYETGPTPSLIVNGTVYRAMERMAPLFRWPQDYQAVTIYADISTNLLDKKNWKMSEPLPFNKSWIPKSWSPIPEAPGYLEGNMVEGPNGHEVYNILRLNTRPYNGNKAIVLQFNRVDRKFIFDSIIDLPGGHTKFVIRRDKKTKMYVTLSNPNTIATAADQRNILSLCTSIDMRNWKEQKILLMDDTGFSSQDSIRYTGFHYVDWQFDGADDIIMAVRTAYRGANSYHNSNRLTYKRIANWKKLLMTETTGHEL